MSISYKPESKGWQTTIISALFAVFLLMAGWLYSGLNERYDKLESALITRALVDSEQNERAAILEEKTKNLKDGQDRIERKVDETNVKLERLLSRPSPR